jgi:hypothetical protein
MTPFSKEFDLNPTAILPGSTARIKLNLTTDFDVVQALANNTPFPDRQIDIGSVSVQGSTGDVNFSVGSGAIKFGASASFQTGVGVYQNADAALSSLQLSEKPSLGLTIAGSPSAHYVVMLWGYGESADVSGSHPIGVLGSLTFGASVSKDGKFAVVHGFDKARGADDVLAETVKSWLLPRQIKEPNDLVPGTWLIAQADGSLALNIAAKLGYDFDFSRAIQLKGLSANLGAKIDASAQATLGFTASGSYLIVAGREDASSNLRLRLFKESDRGFSFGLNLTVGVQAHTDLPATLNDFVQAVFGTHGSQVLNELSAWTSGDLGGQVAGLVDSELQKLLTSATGIDAATAFDAAKQKLTDALALWASLPGRTSSALWKLLGSLSPTGAADFKLFVVALATADPTARAQAVADAIGKVAFGGTPQGEWLESLADQGLLALTNQLDFVSQAAQTTLNILNGGVIAELQKYIVNALNLTPVLQAVDQASFNSLNSWLMTRLGDFFDKTLGFADLKTVQAAINTVITKAPDIYQKALKAATKQYSASFAATYNSTTTDTALLDVTFDMSDPEAASLYNDVVANSNLNRLLTTDIATVKLQKASLSHEIKRNTDIKVQLPYFDYDFSHINDSIATLGAEEDGGRVLVYNLKATDTVRVKSRMFSQLSALATIRNGVISSDSSVAYELRSAKAAMRYAELDFATRPFIQEDLSALFTGGDASVDSFFIGLDQTISNVLGNGSNDFADMLISEQTILPEAVIAAFLQQRDDADLKRAQMNASRSLQAGLKRLIPLYYFADLNNLQPNPSAAALLVWSSFPVSTTIAADNSGNLRFNTDTDFFWNWPDSSLVEAVIRDSHTVAALAASMAVAYNRWIQAGNKSNAGFFAPGQAGSFLQSANRTLVNSLLFTEAQMVRGFADSLSNVRGFLSNLATAPVKAMAELADFGAQITSTFNGDLSVYGQGHLRPLNTMLVLTAASAISPDLALSSKSLLNITVLKSGHTFNLSDFLDGDTPEKGDIALGQNLISS